MFEVKIYNKFFELNDIYIIFREETRKYLL